MPEETTFFQQGGYQVTSARFITPGKTYALSGVTSVHQGRIDASLKPPLVVGAIGVLVLLLASGSGKVLGVLLVGLAIWMFTRLRATHTVVITSASGESEALSSQDGEMVGQVVAAINDAIVHRG